MRLRAARIVIEVPWRPGLPEINRIVDLLDCDGVIHRNAYRRVGDGYAQSGCDGHLGLTNADIVAWRRPVAEVHEDAVRAVCQSGFVAVFLAPEEA